MIESKVLESFIESAFSRSLRVLDPNKVFAPLLFTQKADADSPTTDVLTTDSLEQAFSQAQDIINQQLDELALYAIVWDADVKVEGQPFKALMVEFGVEQDAQGAVIAQRYSWQEDGPVAYDRPIRARQVQSRLGAVGPFTRLQWLDIVKAPALAFVAIAGADGNFNDDKLGAFSKYLAAPDKLSGKLSKAAIAHTGPLLEEILKRAPNSPVEVLAQIHKAQTLVKENEPSEYRQFCEDLYKIAAAVAKKASRNTQAANGILLTLGKQLSDQPNPVN